MRKYALLLCLAFSGFLFAAPALAGSGGQGNVNVTSDTSCALPNFTDNQISSGESIYVWIAPSVDTGDSLSYTITNANDVIFGPLALTWVCTDANTGFSLWNTGKVGSNLSPNLGNGNKTSESYSISVYDNTTETNLGGDSFRRV